MLTKNEQRVLKKGSVQKISETLLSYTNSLTKDESKKILWDLLKRSCFDYQMARVLKERQCEMNLPLEEYRFGDYLSAYGRLSPRLIYEMAQAGYNFTVSNLRGEHVGFYLIYDEMLNDKVISALKKQGVDFNSKNKEGLTAVDKMTELFRVCSEFTAKKRMSGLFNTRDELIDLIQCQNDREHVRNLLQRKIDSLPPMSYKDVGIRHIQEENISAANIYDQVIYYIRKEANLKKRKGEYRQHASFIREVAETNRDLQCFRAEYEEKLKKYADVLNQKICSNTQLPLLLEEKNRNR